MSVTFDDGILLAVRRPNRVPENTKVVPGDLEKELRRSAETWRKWYNWLQWYFPDEEAHDYAEELTQVAEGRKRETERSPHEIRREMKLLANIEALINARRLLVTIAALASPFYFLLLRSSFLDSLLDSETAAATWVRVEVGISCVVLAVVVWNTPFWDNCLTVLRRTRLGCFWEWRSATLRFPVKTIIPSGLFDTSQGKRQIAAVRSFTTCTLRFLKTQAITRRKLAIQYQSAVRLHPGQNARFSATASAFSRLPGFFRLQDTSYQTTGHEACKVRVTGYLLWDDDHNGSADMDSTIEYFSKNGFHHPWRSTAWEIHPVMKIEMIE